MRSKRLLLLATALISYFPGFHGASEITVGLQKPARQLLKAADHKYEVQEAITLYANKVGPYANPSESYQYFTLPFCTPKGGKQYKLEGLGEVLEGDRLVNTPYELEFRVDKSNKALCSLEMSKKDLRKLRRAIMRDYYFQMYYDDLPIWGFIGKSAEMAGPEAGSAQGSKAHMAYLLFSHYHFDIAYNGDRVIDVNVSADPEKMVDISSKVERQVVDFTYSVRWIETSQPFERRMSKYSRYSFLPQHLEIHWFSIVNSCVTVLLLTGFLATILLRVVKNDFVRFMRDEESADDQEETGWKYLHGDVFRPPRHLALFCACTGTGAQVFAMAMSIFALALVGLFYPYNRGSLLTACVVLYALTAGIAGYTSLTLYRMLGGSNWVRCVLMTGGLFCGPLLLTFMFLNTVAIGYRSTAALPFGTICIIVVLWALVTLPLTIIGAIAGKNSKMEFEPPCRTTKFPREVPAVPWYRTAVPQMLIAGFLPFSAIYIELYYIFASIWGYKVYLVWPIILIVFVLLLIVTAFINIALTYFQLAVEDHRWWWRSLLCGASTGGFVYAYCFYFFSARSDMHGLMQTSFFFGYMGVSCWAFSLMLGAVGFRASLTFVRIIYRTIKIE
ncbi:hypothetical protein WJX73_001092 [Symbiochloris irregularis]|uniref:Transmembrane 9 superfamily member n=1 Tax=Symbiochloris irregularis TaxID=706552 RepID=A0AAW1NZG5_9CHLO